MDEIEKAREQLEFVLSLGDNPSWESDVVSSKKSARELLQDKKFSKD
jgi:hypothetical protein